METFGAPIIIQEANRELFEEQVEIVFKAFNNESFSHKGQHYAIPADVPYRGYQLKELTLVPRPVNLAVEFWQPIVSASTRGIEFMLRHGIRGLVGGGAAAMAEGPIQAYQRVANSMGHNFQLGEGLAIGVSFYLAKTREQAIREMLPYYEEHVKMFAPLGFVPGITPAQVEAAARRGGWDDGRALDVRFATRLFDAVKAARAMRRGGVGWYPHSGFIHLDTGPVRNWDLDERGLQDLLIARSSTPAGPSPRGKMVVNGPATVIIERGKPPVMLTGRGWSPLPSREDLSRSLTDRF